jgi:hypothetical protein
MDLRAFTHKLRYSSFFIPFRFQLVLLVVALLLAWRWMNKTNLLPETSYSAIISLFIEMSMWFFGVLLAFSLLTSIIPWLFMLLQKKQGNVKFQIKTSSKENKSADKQEVFISINPILRPFMGFVRLRLKYDKNSISEKFSLLDNKQRIQFFPTSISGYYYWPLPDIKEYNVSSSIIYFEDMLQLFSFAVKLDTSDKFYVQPDQRKYEDLKVQPKKTVETNTRIEQIRKVEGEFLNYKNFENNDDVRRIVWKIYAKNKELVIRIPETNDPYASHVYFYASFYNDLSGNLYEEFNNVFLNLFKTVTWNAFNQLSKQEVEVKFIPDQEMRLGNVENSFERIKYAISTSEWHKNKDIRSYFRKEDASVLVVSSLTNVKQLEPIFESACRDLVVIFVQLSKAFYGFKIKDWFQWVFVKPSPHSLDKLRLAWNVSPLKKRITENEKDILDALSKTDCEKIIV